ncbi:MAG: hypothetical protein NVSMB2_09590 [Chloroflexota bacterium]
MRYAGQVPSEASAAEDTRVWIGHVASGREAEHEQFLAWLNSTAAQDIFQRRRLTEYTLWQDGPSLRVVFKAPHTGDPRLMIDVLRYPGLWPDFWEFERAGGPADVVGSGDNKVHWHRASA